MTKYDAKRPSPYDERRQSISAMETAARAAAREKQRQRLREAQAKANAKNNKYHNQKTTRLIDGQRVLFDSEREASRWDDLYLLQRAHKIERLQRQVRYRLIPAQKTAEGKIIEKPCDYIADFTYYQDGQLIVEDAKGRRTPDYIIKRKLMLYVHGIRVREV